MNRQIDAERILDAFLAPEADRLADRVIDAALADIARTPQRLAMRVPWRFPHMPALTRATGVAAVALVAIVGAGGLILVNSPRSGSGGGPQPSPAPQSPAPTPLPSGISGWTTYTSSTYSGLSLGYPADWSVRAPAIRKWQAGDPFPADAMPYADTFVSPGSGDTQIGLIVWQMRAGEGASLDSTDSLKAWAEGFCRDIGAPSCDAFTQHAVPLIRTNGGAYGSAVLVPTASHQFAFIAECNSCLLTGSRDLVTVVVVAREDSFPSAACYGGSVELLKDILGTMYVFLRGTS